MAIQAKLAGNFRILHHVDGLVHDGSWYGRECLIKLRTKEFDQLTVTNPLQSSPLVRVVITRIHVYRLGVPPGGKLLKQALRGFSITELREEPSQILKNIPI